MRNMADSRCLERFSIWLRIDKQPPELCHRPRKLLMGLISIGRMVYVIWAAVAQNQALQFAGIVQLTVYGIVCSSESLSIYPCYHA